MLNVILVLAGVLMVFLFWVMLYDSTHFQTTEYLVTDPRIRKNFRAVILADLHNKKYGRDNCLLLEEIRKGKPEVVFIAGDLLTAKAGEDFQPALDLLKELAKDYKICYGVGNHEHRLKLYPEIYGDMAKRYEEALSGLKTPLMVNQTIFWEELGVSVTGSEIGRDYYQRLKKYPMEPDYLNELLGRTAQGYFRILLAHNPDYFPEYAGWGADLVLSGHVHGGVARIPFWNKGVISPAIRFFPKYDGGLFEEKGCHMILSRGLGGHTIPVRLFNPGDLIFVEFRQGQAGIEKIPLKTSKPVIK